MAGAELGGTRARAGGVDLGWDQSERPPASRPGPDWKRWFLILGLGGLSWVATYVGMLELIEANVGDLVLSHKVIIALSVAMLMVMVVWLLDQIFSDIGGLTRLLFIGGYVFLTLISVGFGFGFYWKVLESRGEASRSAEAAVGHVQTALHVGVTRLEQLQGTLDTLTTISAAKATLERERGTSCPNSRPGDGPRRQLRDDDASRFKFAADFVRARVGGIKNELSGLNGDLARITSNDRSTVDAASGTRNDFMRGLNRRLDMTATGFNAFRSDPQLRQIRSDLAERADRVSFADTRGGTFQCPDAQLSTALKGVVRAIDELPSLEKPKIAAVEGSEAVIEAFRRLSASLVGVLSFKMPPSAEELRELQKRAVQSVEATPAAQARFNAMVAEAGLSKRDYIPLAIAIFVDLCLLLVSIKRPTRGLDRLVPKMRAAERGPVIQILSRFNEIHRDREIRENFEVFRHVVFDFHGDYYAAVPLNAPFRPNPRSPHHGVAEAETLQQEAHLLVNLFASFEKERVFTRVMSPLLTTGTIQKRLRRQGSKFADADAFRVYRFRNGAWSDIILGAVMGAARRVESEKRRRRLEEDLFRPGGPDFDGPWPPPPGGRQRQETISDFERNPRRAMRGVNGRDEWPADRASISRTGSRQKRSGFSPRIVPTVVSDPAARRGEASASELQHGEVADVRATDDIPGENVVLHPAVGRSEAAPAWDRVPSSSAPPEDAGAITKPEVPEPNVDPAVAPLQPEVRGGTIEPTTAAAAAEERMSHALPASEARLPESLLGPAPNAEIQDDLEAIALRFGPQKREQ